MKFWNCEHVAQSQTEWHDKFAWRPTRVSDDLVVWLETYRRKLVWEGETGYYHYDYRWIDSEGYVTNKVWRGFTEYAGGPW